MCGNLTEEEEILCNRDVVLQKNGENFKDEICEQQGNFKENASRNELILRILRRHHNNNSKTSLFNCKSIAYLFNSLKQESETFWSE